MQEEIFKTKEGVISHCEITGSFFLSYKGEDIEFKLCDLYAFKSRILNLDLMNLLDASSPDIELVSLPHCDRILMLDVYDVLQFRDLLNGTFTILQLNSSVHKILRKNVFNF
jgi:hypothetical protein